MRPRYLRECRRVLKPGGWMYLSTAPYLSFAGAHLPRLKVPVPLHLIFGRTIAFKTFVQLAKHAPWTLREPEDENTFIKLARQNKLKDDDLLELVRVKRLRGQVADAGLRVVLRAPARHEDVQEPAGPDRPLGSRLPLVAGRGHQQHRVRHRQGEG